MLVEHLGVEADQFLGGEGVEIAADGIHRARDIFGRALRRALEQHVLDEVRDAVLFGGFAPRTGADPDSHRHGTHVRHGFGNHADAVGERGHFNVAHGTGVVELHGCEHELGESEPELSLLIDLLPADLLRVTHAVRHGGTWDQPPTSMR